MEKANCEMKRNSREIISLNETARKASYAHWDSLAKPLGSLGMLEDIVAHIAAITGDPDVRLDCRTLLVLCGDHGVIGNGVTQTGASVTAAVAKAIGENTSTISYLAAGQNIEVIPVDVGMLPHPDFPGVQNRNVRPGTADLSREPAMTREEALFAVEAGIRKAEELAEAGYRILAGGEMGIGNTTTSSAIAAVMLSADPSEVTGVGAGLSAEGLRKKVSVIRKAIEVNRPDPEDPLDVLTKVGGFDIAALTGLFLGGAACRTPVVIDGFISAVAALLAARIAPASRGYMLPSHISGEPATGMVMNALGFGPEAEVSPVLHAGMHLGEGTGAVALFPLLDMACDVYRQMETFEGIDVAQYEDYAAAENSESDHR